MPVTASQQNTRNFIHLINPLEEMRLLRAFTEKECQKNTGKPSGKHQIMTKTDSVVPQPPPRPQPQEPPGQEGDTGEKSLYLQVEKAPRSALLQRNEPGGVGGTDAGSAVLHRLVRDGELPQVVADHLGLEEKGELRVGRQRW